MNIIDLVPEDAKQVAFEHFSRLIEFGESSGEIKFKKKDKSIGYWIVDAVKLSEKRFLGTVKDISERKKIEAVVKQNSDRLKILFDLSQMSEIDVADIYDFALEKSIELCNSKIGFLGFVKNDEKIVSIHAWSASTMKICEIKNKYIDFEVEKAGVWGESIRQRKALIINDLKAKLPDKKGMPEGHVQLNNYLSVPIFKKNKIVAVISLGNKNCDYNQTDIQELTLLMDGVWNIIKQRENEKELLLAKIKAEKSEHELRHKNEEYEAINEELRQMNEELYAAKQKAEESGKLKTAFLQNMSHEIRTPMNAIVGFSEMLMKTNISEEKRKSFAEIIINSSIQLLTIVNDILTISSIETNQEKINIKKVNINSIIIDLLNKYNKLAFNQNISLFTKKNLTNLDAEIYTDEEKITQILNNLISNAIKFTHEGTVEFGYELNKNELIFYVKDTGIGIDENQIENIFDRFTQADYGLNRKYEGTGLGLAISKGFTELLGGRIWVETKKDVGSKFYFSIPYNPVNSNIEKSNKNFKLNILVAEDEEYNYLFIEELLIEQGYNIFHAKTGKEAIEICEKNENIRLILMDIKMPDLDGYTAALEIKKKFPDIVVVAQTAYALAKEKSNFSKKAFDDYITKPINANELIEKVAAFTRMNNI